MLADIKKTVSTSMSVESTLESIQYFIINTISVKFIEQGVH